jgi:cytochrome bd-type quinol oxidase subunit 2
MWQLALLPFVIQAIVIACDEIFFHIRRGLPRWERLGHPIDTFTVLICFGYVLFVPFSSSALIGYTIAAVFSMLFVTKDEFIHKEHCCGKEQWLHAILFILHPLTLIFAGLIWPVINNVEVSPWINNWLSNPQYLQVFFYVQFGFMLLFMLYQIVFWNVIWKEKPLAKK